MSVIEKYQFLQSIHSPGLKFRGGIILVVILMLFAGSAKMHAQNFAEDFKAINRAYITGDLSFNLRYDYYNDYKSTKPSYFYSGVVKMKGPMVYYNMNGIEFCYDSIYTCIVDQANKAIMFDTVRNKGNMAAKVNFIDSLTKVYKSVAYKPMDNNLAKYTVYSLSPGVSHSEIIFDRADMLIQKITIYFLDNRDGAAAGAIRNKLVISYTNINTGANNAAAIFRAQRIVQIKGRKVTPRPAYQQYSIINNMEEL